MMVLTINTAVHAHIFRPAALILAETPKRRPERARRSRATAPPADAAPPKVSQGLGSGLGWVWDDVAMRRVIVLCSRIV